jgi:LSD1 subclass zinc finger protein
MAALESLLCNSCGAPLQIPSSANYVKCNHCHTQLAVHRESGVSFTEAIDKLNQTTENLSEQVSRLAAQQELADLDREWDRRRQDLMISDQDGRRHVPNSTASTIGGIIAVCFGGFWTIMACGITSNSPFGGVGLFPLFGLVFMAFGVYGIFHHNAKAAEYQRAETSYKRQRNKLRKKNRGTVDDQHDSLEIDP